MKPYEAWNLVHTYFHFRVCQDMRMRLQASKSQACIQRQPIQISWPVSALTERYFQTYQNIIYNEKCQRRGGSGSATTLQTKPTITKSNKWKPLKENVRNLKKTINLLLMRWYLVRGLSFLKTCVSGRMWVLFILL